VFATYKIFSSSKRKFLFLIPLAFLVINSLFNVYTTNEIQRALLLEKCDDIVTWINTLSAEVNSDALSGNYTYSDRLSVIAAFFDSRHDVYARAYVRHDDTLDLISEQTPDLTPFDPCNYEEFTKAALNQDSGILIIKYKPTDMAEIREMHVYFKWMPSQGYQSVRVLFVAAVSKYSVFNTVGFWVALGQWTGTLINFCLFVLALIILSFLGSIWQQRKGDKWRKEEGT